MAFGEHKSGIVYKAVEQPPTEAVSASFLQEHKDEIAGASTTAAAERADRDQPPVGSRAVYVDRQNWSAKRSSCSR